MGNAMRIAGWFAVLVILFFTGLLGVVATVDDFGKVDTVPKMVYTILLGACGCFGLAAGLAVLSRRSGAKVLILGWASTMLGVGLSAPLAWGWSDLLPTLGMISMILLLGGLTYLGWKAATRTQADRRRP
jgi:hypothetical protein